MTHRKSYLLPFAVVATPLMARDDIACCYDVLLRATNYYYSSCRAQYIVCDEERRGRDKKVFEEIFFLVLIQSVPSLLRGLWSLARALEKL